jgi:hypothetical protein
MTRTRAGKHEISDEGDDNPVTGIRTEVYYTLSDSEKMGSAGG